MSFVSKICVHAISPKIVLLVSENQRCLNKVTMAFAVLQSSFRPFHTHCKILHYRLGSTTFRRGRLGAGRLGAADYAPGLLGAWTFRRRDF